MNKIISSDGEIHLDIDLTDDLKNRCLQYLLDDLDSEQVELFEKALSESASLGDELNRQAEAISMLSEIHSGEGIPAPVQTDSGQQTVTLRKIACIALAVCFAGMMVRGWWQTPGSVAQSEVAQPGIVPPLAADNVTDLQPVAVPEFTLIARAWADNQLREDTGFQQSETLPDTIGDYFEETGSEVNDISSEPAFSWMFIAASEIQELGTDDG
jgi:hypothetical protein